MENEHNLPKTPVTIQLRPYFLVLMLLCAYLFVRGIVFAGAGISVFICAVVFAISCLYFFHSIKRPIPRNSYPYLAVILLAAISCALFENTGIRSRPYLFHPQENNHPRSAYHFEHSHPLYHLNSLPENGFICRAVWLHPPAAAHNMFYGHAVHRILHPDCWSSKNLSPRENTHHTLCRNMHRHRFRQYRWTGHKAECRQVSGRFIA